MASDIFQTSVQIPPNVSLGPGKTHIFEISFWCHLFESVTMFLTLQRTSSPLCKTIFYLFIPTDPHMKNFPTIMLHGISKEWAHLDLSEKNRKVYFEKWEIIKAFGVKRKQLELYLRRHKDNIPTTKYEEGKTTKTLIHVSILPYLIRCLTDSRKPKKEDKKEG